MIKRYVPPAITDQVKQGFSGPDATWFRGESIDYIRRVIDADDSRIYEFVRPESVRSLVEEHLSGGENRRLLLWSLLNLEHWCRTFMEGGENPTETLAPEYERAGTPG